MGLLAGSVYNEICMNYSPGQREKDIKKELKELQVVQEQKGRNRSTSI